MADYNPTRDAALAKLYARFKANLAVEEAFVTALADLLAESRDEISDRELRHLTGLIRHHRVGLVKQRALMGAIGIDV